MEFSRITKQILGCKHRRLAVGVSFIGDIHFRNKDFEKALSFYKEALSINIAAFNKIHPNIATALNKIGNAYYQKGEVDKAFIVYQAELMMERKIFVNDHPRIIITL